MARTRDEEPERPVPGQGILEARETGSVAHPRDPLLVARRSIRAPQRSAVLAVVGNQIDPVLEEAESGSAAVAGSGADVSQPVGARRGAVRAPELVSMLSVGGGGIAHAAVPETLGGGRRERPTAP